MTTNIILHILNRWVRGRLTRVEFTRIRRTFYFQKQRSVVSKVKKKFSRSFLVIERSNLTHYFCLHNSQCGEVECEEISESFANEGKKRAIDVQLQSVHVLSQRLMNQSIREIRMQYTVGFPLGNFFKNIFKICIILVQLISCWAGNSFFSVHPTL
jgi:hypothetical protein